MAQVFANPDDLDLFATQLGQFNAQLAESIARLDGQFGRLGDTWRDQEHARFAEEFQYTVKVLHDFMRSADEQVPFLRRKAERLRDFLHQR